MERELIGMIRSPKAPEGERMMGMTEKDRELLRIMHSDPGRRCILAASYSAVSLLKEGNLEGAEEIREALQGYSRGAYKRAIYAARWIMKNARPDLAEDLEQTVFWIRRELLGREATA